jgi:hypothetical protein
MSIGYEIQPSSNQGEAKAISHELTTYVFECIPPSGEVMPLERIAEDLEETPDMILMAMQELRADKFLDFIHSDGIITITYRNEEYLRVYSVYQDVRRSQ